VQGLIVFLDQLHILNHMEVPLVMASNETRVVKNSKIEVFDQ